MKAEEVKALFNHPYFWPHDVNNALGAYPQYKFNQDVVPQSVEAFNKKYGTHFNRDDLLYLSKLI